MALSGPVLIKFGGQVHRRLPTAPIVRVITTLQTTSSFEASRVLLADADPVVRRKAEEILARAGFEVLTGSGTGDSTLLEFDRYKPDIVVLSLRMRDGDAIAVGAALRAKDSGRLVPLVISVEDDADSDSLRRAHELQFVDFVRSPIPWGILPYRLLHLLHSTQMGDALRSGERRILTLLQAIPDMIFVLDHNNVVLDHMGRSQSSVDGRPVNLVGQSIDNFLPPEVAQKAQHHCKLLRATGEIQTYDYSFPDGHAFETRLILQPDATIMAIVRDITARRKSEAKIHHLAFYDQLTGLPNREHFKQTLRGAIRQAQGNGSVLALLYIDLDRFKRINDTFGHGLGDGLLKSVANRLKGCIRRNEETGRDARAGGKREVLARLSGDEFIVLVTGVEGEGR